MARPKPAPNDEPDMVSTTILNDAHKLERAKGYLNAPTDADVLRMALDHLLSHFEEPAEDE